MVRHLPVFFFFFFNDTATTEIYTLSLHDALPIYLPRSAWNDDPHRTLPSVDKPIPEFGTRHQALFVTTEFRNRFIEDRKSTRLNSSHTVISYAVFCLRKKKDLEYFSLYTIIVILV